MIQAVLFDMDGTLIDTEKYYRIFWPKALAACGYTMTDEQALTKLFNTIMMRAGVTLIITTAFSISTMFYSISSGYPFFMIAFLKTTNV